MPKFVLLLTVAATILSASLKAQLVNPSAVTIRVYNGFGVPLRQLKEAQRSADTIFENAGLAPAWRECRTPEGPSAKSSDMCADVLESRELIVRIVAAPSSLNNDDFALGYSHVDAGAGAGTLSTVFADRASIMSRHLGVDMFVVLGRVIAHEVGHLLMGTMTHSSDGLMRERWSGDALPFTGKKDWLFSEREIAFLHQGLLARQQGLPLPVINLAERTSRITP